MLLAAVFVLWLFSLWMSARAAGSLVNPATAFVTAWLVSAAAAGSGLVHLFPLAWGEEAFLVGGVAAMLAGAFVVDCAEGGRRTGTLREPLPGGMVLLVSAIGFAGFGFLLFALSRQVSLLVYWIAPERVERLGFQRPVVGYLNLLHIVLPALLWLQGMRSRRHRWAWKGLALLSLLTTPFAGIKTYFVQSALTLVLAGLYEAAQPSLRRLAVGGALALTALVGFFVVYDRYFKEDRVDYVAEGVVDLPSVLAPLAHPLVYVTGPVATFGPFTRFQEDVYYGRATFRAATKSIQRFEPLAAPPANGDWYTVPIPFNTYSLFREFYEDGREAGILAFSFLVGMLLQAVFFAMRKDATIPLVVLTAYLTMTQVLGPFVGFLVAPRSVFFAVVLLGLHAFGRRIPGSATAGARGERTSLRPWGPWG